MTQTETFIIAWFWAAVLFVLLWTIWSAYYMVTDAQVVRIGQQAGRTARQFDLFITAMSQGQSDTPLSEKPISSHLLAEMRSLLVAVDAEALRLGITRDELLERILKEVSRGIDKNPK